MSEPQNHRLSDGREGPPEPAMARPDASDADRARLHQLEQVLEAKGGRDVQLAEEIDALREKLGKPSLEQAQAAAKAKERQQAATEGPIPPPKFVVTEHSYRCDQGREVTHAEIVSGEAPDDFVPFRGKNALNVAPELAPFLNGATRAPYVFPIDDATTLEEAFVKWEDAARHYGQKHMEGLQNQIRQRMRAQQAAQAGMDVSDGGVLLAPPGSAPPPPRPAGKPRIELPD